MKKNEPNTRILFYPTIYTSENRNLNNLYKIIKDRYEVASFDKVKKGDYFKYDVYHFNFIEGTSGNLMSQKLDYLKKKLFINVLKLLKKKIIWTVHNNIPHETDNKRLTINFMEFMAKKSDKIHIFCTDTLNNNFLKKYKDKTVLIPHWDYVWNYPKGNISIYSKYDIPTNKKIILFIGQIRKYKNIELLIKAFVESRLGENDFILLICGKCWDPVYRRELKNLSNQDVYFDFNFINDFEMESYLRQSQILVAPFNKISSLNSWTLWMAMSYKKTMMLPLIWCVKDIKDYEDFLYIYDYKEDHYEKLLGCMLKLKNDLSKNEYELEVKGKKAYNYIIKNQSRKVQKENWINLYKF